MEEVTPSVLLTMQHPPLEQARWPNLFACHAVCLVESSVLLSLYKCRNDRIPYSFHLFDAQHRLTRELCLSIYSPGSISRLFFPFPVHCTPRRKREEASIPLS